MIRSRITKYLRSKWHGGTHKSARCDETRILTGISITLALTLSAILLVPPSVSTANGKEKDYVFVKSIKGEVAMQIMRERGPSYMIVRRLEMLYPRTILRIGQGASVTLHCAGCREVLLTHANSPYIIQMKDFQPEGTNLSKTLKYLTAALNTLIYPDSVLGDLVHPQVRGPSPCLVLQPKGPVVAIKKEMIFIWTSNAVRTPVTFKVLDAETRKIIYSKEMITSNRVNMLSDRFEAGKKYEWSITEYNGNTYNETFILVPSDEKERIMAIIKELDVTIPVGVEQEDRYHIQAGFLNSERYTYDAYLWLEMHRGQNR